MEHILEKKSVEINDFDPVTIVDRQQNPEHKSMVVHAPCNTRIIQELSHFSTPVNQICWLPSADKNWHVFFVIVKYGMHVHVHVNFLPWFVPAPFSNHSYFLIRWVCAALSPLDALQRNTPFCSQALENRIDDPWPIAHPLTPPQHVSHMPIAEC